MQSTPSHPSIDPQIEAEYLADNADVRTKEPVKYYFTESELIEKKAIYFELSSKVARREELTAELKDIAHNSISPRELLQEIMEIMPGSDKFGAPLKTLKSEAGALLKEINYGYKSEEQVLFGFAHYDCNRMAYYDDQGLFVYDRPLKPGENQTTILQMRKSA